MMNRYFVRAGAVLGALVVGLVVLSARGGAQADQSGDQTAGQSPPVQSPVPALREKLRESRGFLDASTARSLGSALVGSQYAIRFLNAPGVSSDVVDTVGRALGDRQLEWQSRRRKGISEIELIRRLNTILRTENLPEFLKFRPRDVRRARVVMRLTIPEIRNLDSARALLAQDPRQRRGQFAPTEMSPLEAFVLADFLLYSKSFDDDFLRTTAEDHAAVRKGQEVTRRKPGINQLPNNPRRGMLESHIAAMARDRQMTTSDGVAMILALLDGEK